MMRTTQEDSPTPVRSLALALAWATAPKDDVAIATQIWPSPAPVTCEPWCDAQDGHPNQRLREDQCCLGAEHRVPLSEEPPERLGEGSTEQQYLNTYLMRLADDTAPRVFIGYNEAPGRPATVAEARHFAQEILALVDGLEAGLSV
jgi:hypothetical protein